MDPTLGKNEFFTKIVQFWETLREVSKYEVFSGPYFPAFGQNTDRYEVSHKTYQNNV